MFILFLFCFFSISQEQDVNQVPATTATQPVSAEPTTTISGIILERGTRKPLADVAIYLLPQKTKAVSDQNGNFLFEGVQPQVCSVIVNLTGYNKYEKETSCKEPGRMSIYLEKVLYTGFETTVTSKAEKRDDQTQTLTQEDFMKTAGTFGGDPVRAAQNLPGVSSQGASAEVIVQGASPDDTGYLINGHRVPLVFHFGGLSSVVIPEAVEKVELLPSGYGPEYSRAIGGIIGITTKEPKKDRTHGMAYVDLLNSGGLLEGAINETSSFLVSARYSYIGQVLKAAANEMETTTLTTAPTFYDFTGIYNNQINANNKFKTTFVLSSDELELIVNKAFADDPALRGRLSNTTDFFRVIPQMITQLGPDHKMDNSLGFGKDKLIVNIGTNYLNVDSDVISQRSEVISKWSETYKTFLGLDNQWTNTNVRINLPTEGTVGGVPTPFSAGEEQRFTAQVSQYQLGAYLRQEIKIFEDSNWTFLPNLRVDQFSLSDSSELQPRLQIRYQWDSSLLLRASVGRYAQAPLPQETSKEYGNESLKPLSAMHYTAGFSKDFKNGSNQGFEVTNNYFYKTLDNLVFPDIVSRYANSGTGTIYGAEVQAKYRKDKWSSQLVYTFLNSKRTIPGFGTQPSEFDQTHNLNLIGSYTTARWTFGGRFRFVTGLPYTPVIGATYDSNNDVFIPAAGTIFSQRFDSFQQFDLRIDRKFIYDKWILNVYFDVQNLLNRKNTQSIEYSYDFKNQENVAGLPILPTFGVKGEF